MKEYKINGKVVEMTLDDGKVVKCATDWAERTMKALDTDMEDVLLMWLEDNGYLVNDEQAELDEQAKGKVKLIARIEKVEKPKAKTQKERVFKPQPDKEYIISLIAELLQYNQDISNLNIENKAKLITFDYKNENYKLDLVQKRKPKEK